MGRTRSGRLRAAATVALVGLLVPRPSTSQRRDAWPLDRRGAAMARIDTLCGLNIQGDTVAGADSSSAHVPRDRTDPEAWFQLGCRHSRAFRARSTGLLELTSQDRDDASLALRAFGTALQLDPASRRPARGFAILSVELLDEGYRVVAPRDRRSLIAHPVVPPVDAMLEVMIAAVRSGITDSIVFRACVDAALAVGDAAALRYCNHQALKAGADSTWHLVRRAFVDTRAGLIDSLAAHFDLATLAARDSSSVHEIALHVGGPPGFHPIGARAFDSTNWVMKQIMGLAPAGRVEFTRAAAQRYFDHSDSTYVSVLARHFDLLVHDGNALFGCNTLNADTSLIASPAQVRWCQDYMPFGPPAMPARVLSAWDAAGHSITVVAAATASADPLSATTLRFRQWSQSSHAFSDSVVSALAPRGARGLVGAFPELPERSSWTVAAGYLGAPTRRAVRDSTARPGRPALALSDLFLGTADDPVWQRDTQSVHIRPDGVFRRAEPVTLFFEFRTPASDTVRRAVVRVSDVRTGRSVLSIGLSEFDRAIDVQSNHRYTLDLSRLKAAEYTITVELVALDGRVLATSASVIRLR